MRTKFAVTASWFLLAVASSACINVATDAVSRDQQINSYVRRRPASKDQPRMVASIRGPSLAVVMVRQPICTEETIVVVQRIEQTTTSPASEKDQQTLSALWIGGALSTVAGAILVGIAPSLSNETTQDDQGNEQASNRHTAYGLGALGLGIGLPTLLAAAIDAGKIGTTEKKVGIPAATPVGSKDVPCGTGQPIANAEVTISGGSTSAAAGHTNSQGRLDVDLRDLPKSVREEIASGGRLFVTTEEPARAAFESTIRNDTAALLLAEGATSVRQSRQVALGNGLQAQAELPPEAGRGIVLKKCEIQDGQKGMAMGNGNGRIDRGEMVEVTCQIENRGSNLDYSFRLDIVSENPDVILSGIPNIERIGWQPRVVESVRFALSVKKRYSLAGSTPLPVKIRIARSTGQIVADVPLDLYLGDGPTQL